MRIPAALLAPLLAASLVAPARAGGPVAGGGGESAPPAGESCIPAAQLDAIRASLPPFTGGERMPQVTLYADPMGGGGINSFGKTITNYVDLDPSTSLLDWNCGTVTYDGHAGNDIEIRDFYDQDEGVPVLAAAPGTVVHTHDGEFDRRTAWINGVVANDVIVQHADGSYAYYWHLRKGSVRVALNQPVATGDTLGFVGSSGFSSGPHLHFETYDAGTREPSTGPCQAQPTRWISQPPYVWTYPVQLFNSGISTLALDWPTICERPPVKTHVVAGSNLYHWFRIRNVRTTDLLEVRISSPLGAWSSYSFHPSANYSSSWWYIWWTMPTAPSLFGNWHSDFYVNGVFQATYAYALNGNANQAPTVASRSVNVPTNGSIDVDLAGSDPDGSVFRHEILGGSFHGTAELRRARARVLHYVPASSFTGEDSVTVRAVDDENLPGALAVIRLHVGTSVDAPPGAPAALALARIAPDPVRASSRVSFTLPAAGETALDVLDPAGRRAASWSATLAAGAHNVAWSELTAGRVLPPGLYFVRLRAAGASVVRRVTALR